MRVREFYVCYVGQSISTENAQMKTRTYIEVNQHNNQ